MDAPRILIVDDQHDVSRMLRSSLELSGLGYTVIDVPSGEEALIELTRGPFNLLVTDLRLPGISGLELLERFREIHPHARAIIITGHPTSEARSRAEELGVVAFFQKPIATSFFLEAVGRALKLQDGDGVQLEQEEKADLSAILDRVRHALTAVAVFLLDEQAEILVQSGDVRVPDLEKALAPVKEAFSAGLKASSLMGSPIPGNIQYFNGEKHDLYLTNVGPSHGLLIVTRRGQAATKMGAIVHYGRQAAESLLEMMTSMGVQAVSQYAYEMKSKLEWAEYMIEEKPENKVRKSQQREEGIGADKEAEKDWTGSALKGKDEEHVREEARDYWGRVADDTSDFEKEDVLTFKEARDKGLMTDDPETLY